MESRKILDAVYCSICTVTSSEEDDDDGDLFGCKCVISVVIRAVYLQSGMKMSDKRQSRLMYLYFSYIFHNQVVSSI